MCDTSDRCQSRPYNRDSPALPFPRRCPAIMNDPLSSLSRTSSAASFSSDDINIITPSAINASRRTRKRFTNSQLTMLENLFHRTSHPSREEREAVAKAGQMYVFVLPGHRPRRVVSFRSLTLLMLVLGKSNPSQFGSRTNARQSASRRQARRPPAVGQRLLPSVAPLQRVS